MLESTGDIFNQPDADAICFTSNGIVKSNGELVMGAGIAWEFRDRWPILAKFYGSYVKRFGNHVACIQVPVDRAMKRHVTICSFPTKDNWRDKSKLPLIEQSARELTKITTEHKWRRVYLTRPGCGWGGLTWEDVQPRIASLLDDRFTVLTP